MYLLRCDRGKMTPQVSALLLSRPPEQLLLAPKVAPVTWLLPSGVAFWCALIWAAVNLLNCRYISLRWKHETTQWRGHLQSMYLSISVYYRQIWKGLRRSCHTRFGPHCRSHNLRCHFHRLVHRFPIPNCISKTCSRSTQTYSLAVYVDLQSIVSGCQLLFRCSISSSHNCGFVHWL